MTNLIVYPVSVVLVFFYAAVRLRYELQMLQQNSYRLGRYWSWLKQNSQGVDAATDIMMIGLLIIFADSRWNIFAVGGVGAICLFKGIKLLRRKYKKPLVFTARATRLYVVALVLFAGAVALVWWQVDGGWAMVVAMGLATISFAVMCASLVVLMPVERLVNRWYVNDARRILAAMPRLVVVGITGSYGKTSTKHYLYRILSERFNVVMTPGSFNTTLGVVRTIREHLKPYTEVFIVEMGAKQRGDITEICNLVHPRIGILTSVGEQHLESFKTIENVQAAKFELIDSLPADGTAILNDDFPYIANRPVDNVQNVLRYSSADLAQPPFTTRLVGSHNIGNIYAAWLAGKALGMTEAEMRSAISDLRPVEHRLEVKQANGLRIIDDAFNSNPHGAAAALDVLAGFTEGKRIVVTPGMIELGEKQHYYNRELGRQMASACDVAVVVGEYNREAILAGLAQGGFPAENIYMAPTFAAASDHVRQIAAVGDTILYENDLPDTFK